MDKRRRTPMYGVPFFGHRKYAMKNPQTKLGKQLSKILNHRGDEFTLVSSSNEYDTFQIDISDNQVMNLVCHEYPGLAYGILIITKSTYALPADKKLDLLVQAVNKANLKSTSVTTAVEPSDEDGVFTLHFKTFIQFKGRIGVARILDAAVDLHLLEIDEVISPYFKNMSKEKK